MNGGGKESNFASAVAYLHEDAACVDAFLRALSAMLKAHFKQYEIIVVNDAAPDEAVRAVRAFVTDTDGGAPVTLVNMSVRQGLELAMNAGLDAAIGDFLFEFDVMAPACAGDVAFAAYEKALEGHDIVSVGPEHDRSLTSAAFYRLFNATSGSRYPVQTDVMRVLSRRALNRVHAVSPTPAYRKAAYAACGLRLCAMKVPGLSAGADGNRPMRLSLALDALALYTNAAYRLSCTVALVMLGLTLAELVYTLAVFLGGGKPIEGWTTTMFVLTVGFFGVFLILAIVLKYLSLLVDLVFRQQKYLVEGVEKLQP